MRYAGIVLLALLCTGCAEMRARIAAQQEAQRQAINAYDDSQCRSYGVQPGSDGYVACRMNLATNRANQEQINAINQQRQSEAMMAASATLLTPPPMAPAVFVPMNR
jgi:hypothetical protein